MYISVLTQPGGQPWRPSEHCLGTRILFQLQTLHLVVHETDEGETAMILSWDTCLTPFPPPVKEFMS